MTVRLHRPGPYPGNILKTLGLALLACVLAESAFAQETRQLTQDRPSTSEKRTALVIGNGEYLNARKLANPVNDATDMGAALRDVGFEVISGTDLSLKQMNDKVREFGDRLKVNGGVGLFYYAGHGIQVGGRNYLVPIDANIPREDEIEFNALNLDVVLRKLGTANNGLNIIILDACRNNPFARSWSRGEDSGGLAQVSAPIGTFIAYATSPDRTASDGDGRNGLYTSQMLKVLKEPNLKIEEAFKEVRKAVDAASGGNQVPWDSSSLRGEFYFRGSKVQVKAPADIPETRLPPPSERSPTADDVLNAYARAIGSEPAKKITTLVLIGMMETEINGQKINTEIEIYTKLPDKFSRLLRFPTGEINAEVFNGGRGWTASTGKTVEELPASEVEDYKRGNALGMGDVAALKTLYPTITVSGRQKLGDKEVVVVDLKTRDGRTEKMYFDAATKLIDRWQSNSASGTQPGILVPTETDYEDYADIIGYKVPMTLHQRSPGLVITIRFDGLRTKYNVPLADSLFK